VSAEGSPWRLLAPLGLVGLWGAASLTSWGRAHSVPAIGEVACAAVAGVRDGTLLRDAADTLARALAGAGVAVVVGGAVGIGLGSRPSLWRALEPTADFLRSIPPVLVYPLLLLGFGYNEGARLATVAFGAIGMVLLPVAAALARAPAARADVVRLSGLRGWEALRVLHLPEALPALITGARLALGASLVITVVTEMLVGARFGLGVRALAALQEYRPERLWLVVLVAGALNAALSGALVAIERRLVRWSPA
jgi:ABC-type nitrate/sulfonate/bicarbonate transport system permease component